MPKEPLSDTEAAIRAIRLRAMLDRKRFKHLGDPDAPETVREDDDVVGDDQDPDAASAS